MKLIERFSVLFTLLLASAHVACGNIGQTPKEVDAHYGAGKALAAQKPAEEAHTYSFKGIHILVEFWHGGSSSEQYQKTDGSVFSEAEINAILAANVGSASWHQASDDTWVRIDKAAIAYMGDHRKALIVQLYAFHVEEKKNREQARASDKPKLPPPGIAPATMTKIVSRYISSKIMPDSFGAKPKTVYLAGETYLRSEEEEDPEQHLHQLLICSEPDVWMINLDGLKGQHIVDPGPTFVTHFPLMEPSSPGDLFSLDLGKEVTFFQQHQATPRSPQTIDGQSCEVFECKQANYRLVLDIREDTHKPFQLDVFKDDKPEFSIRYMSYETDIPFNAALFLPPASVAITEAKPNS